jgi:hypothetical protein
MKVEIYLIGFISWLLGRTMSRNMAIFFDFLINFGDLKKGIFDVNLFF